MSRKRDVVQKLNNFREKNVPKLTKHGFLPALLFAYKRQDMKPLDDNQVFHLQFVEATK